MKFTVQISFVIAFLWLGSLLFLTTTFNPPGDRSSIDLPSLEHLSQNLNRVGFQTEELKRYTKELRDILEQEIRKDPPQDGKRVPIGRRSIADEQNMGSNEPSKEYEKIRKKVDNGVTELWFYVRSELEKLKKTADTKEKEKLSQILQDGATQQRSILVDIYNLSMHDGHANWRKQEIRDLRTLVRKRIHYLQNPKDCSSAKKLVCNLNKGCGYGCQVHHVAYCMIVAYATERTLILESKGWRYARGGWETVFQPLSTTCTTRGSSHAIRWQDPTTDAFKDTQVVELPIVDGLHPRPNFLPLAIPEDLSDRLIRIHGDPFVWWMGQIMHYILRPQDALKKEMDDSENRLDFKNPVVGVHVRRTDKVGTEAAFHTIEEYMFHVEEYYKKLQRIQEVDKKRVYLATDDDNLLNEAKSKYPDYMFISDNDISKSAALSSRYSENALHGVILDIYFLSKSNYLVCTFSSQVCRVAYELMQDYHTDAAAYFHSLDDIYYFGGQNAHLQVALYEHETKDSSEIQLKPGDIVGVAGNHWNGYSKGTNHRLGRNAGLYPSYKVENKIEIAKMPLYPEAENYQLET